MFFFLITIAINKDYYLFYTFLQNHYIRLLLTLQSKNLPPSNLLTLRMQNQNLPHKKSVSQYLFLNLIKTFSLIYLILNIFYIPVYMGIGEIAAGYWIDNQNVGIGDKILLSGSIAGFFKCNGVNQEKYKKTIEESGVINSQNFIKQQQQQTNNSIIPQPLPPINNKTLLNIQPNNKCSTKSLLFIPFIQSPEQFHNFYFWYGLFFNFFIFLALIKGQINNIKLYLDFQYPQHRYKIYHVKCKSDWPIYMLKILVIKRLEKMLEGRSEKKENKCGKQEIKMSKNDKFEDLEIQNCEGRIQPRQGNIKNVFFLINKQYQSYCQLVKSLQATGNKLDILYQQLKSKPQFSQQQSSQIIMDKILILKDKHQKMVLQKIYKQKQLHEIFNYQGRYHYNHFWIHFDRYETCLRLEKILKQSNSIFNFNKGNKDYASSEQFVMQIDNIEYSDLIRENIEVNQGKEKIKKVENQIEYNSLTKNSQKQNKQTKNMHITFNQRYFTMVWLIKVTKIFLGILICLFLVIVVDVVILIAQKNKILNNITVLIVLILQIILKSFLILFSQFQTHSLYSHQHLSIMIKLTLFLYFNLVVILIIAHHNLGNLFLGRYISSYQFDKIDQEWFLIIGLKILLVVVVQIVYCNARVYIQVVKQIFFSFLTKNVLSIIKFNKNIFRLKKWLKNHKINYQKPIIDLEICYSHILPIYLIGMTFGYLFPILNVMLFLFSITIYHTHKNYIELYTSQIQYSERLLDKWAFSILYGGILMNFLVIGYLNQGKTVAVMVVFCLTLTIWIGKCFLLDIDKMKEKKLISLSRRQNKQRNNKDGEIITQRKLMESQYQHGVKKINSQNRNQADQYNFQQMQKITHFDSRTLQQKQGQTQIPSQKQIINLQRQLKSYEIILMKQFQSKKKNFNQVHGHYYHQYQKIINCQNIFLKSHQQLY